MEKIVECVPNFSEGRDASKVAEIEGAIRGVTGVVFLDSQMDADHNRSVITFAGEPDAVLEAALRAARRAVELIDLNHHRGEHPRIGALDVLPFVPLKGVTMDDCISLARSAGEDIARELNVPVYLYERAAQRPDRVNLADIRNGGFEWLREEIETDPERRPDFGAARVHPTAGAVAVCARPLMVAFNVNLATEDVEVAKKIAGAVRGRDGGLRHVKALGFRLRERGQVQVSMNLVDYEATPIFRAFEMVLREAERYGVVVSGSEIVGLVPQAALDACSDHYLRLENFHPESVLETRLENAMADERLEREDETSRPDRFIEDVSRGSATPGGGSVAACAGALAAALGVMVCHLTIGRERFASAEAETRELLTELDELRAELTRAIDDDARSYERVIAARSLSQGTDAERLQRGIAVEQSIKGAMAVPLRVAEASLDVLERLDELAEIGNPQALSDLGVAGQMALTAVRGAVYLIVANLNALGDEEFSRDMRQELDDLIESGQEAADGIEARVLKRT